MEEINNTMELNDLYDFLMEGPSFEIGGRKTTGLTHMTKADAEKHSDLAAKKHKDERSKVDVPRFEK